MKPYLVYILECADGTFYTGITNQLETRLLQHERGKGAKYTRARLPVRLLYIEHGTDKSWALKREHAIRCLSRQQKQRLILNQGVLGDESSKK